MEENKDHFIEYQIVSVDLLSFGLSNEYLVDPTTEFGFQSKFELKINEEKKRLYLSTEVYVVDMQNQEHILGHVKSLCGFRIANLDSMPKDDRGYFEIPKNYIITFNQIALSTTRGLLHGVFRGTVLHAAVIPVIGQTDFIERIEKSDVDNAE